MNNSPLKLCLVTHPYLDPFENYEQFMRQAIRGGITSVQLRHKTYSPLQMRTLATALLSLLRPLKIPLIINDDIDLAKEVDADGVHLGQSDRTPFEARQLLGADKIIGWSVETWEHVELSNQLSCIDYIAASAVFPSKIKQNCKTIWGLEGLKKITHACIHPVIAIGGIHIGNIAEVMRAGAYGAAVISAIYDSPHPEQATRELLYCARS